MKRYTQSLAETHPEIAAQWHPTKNGNLRPEDVTAGSGKTVWWFFPFDVPDDWPTESIRGKHFDFEWTATINNRVNSAEHPYLTGYKVWCGFNDLVTTHPELAAQWHPTKNGDLTPYDVSAGNGKSVWWQQEFIVPDDWPVESIRGKHFVFEWKARVADRAYTGVGCPYLSGRKVWRGFNDLATTHPEISAQWHPIKNGNLRPEDVTAGSGKTVWWFFPFDVPDDWPTESIRGKHFDFEWKLSVNCRICYESGCPYLSNRKIYRGFNDLATTHPELTKEWHPTKNGGLTPYNVIAGYDKKIWWCIVDGNGHFHEWSATVYSRAYQNANCPDFSDSHGEKFVKKYLNKKNIKFKPQKTFAGLSGLGNGKLSYDLYFKINNKPYLIEYNGRQHYMPIGYFGGNEQFFIQQEHDRRKRKYAKENNITLIEISYEYDTYEKVARFLDEVLIA